MDDKLFDRVSQYLAGLLSKKERKAFEQDLASDRALRDELELQQDLAEALAPHPEEDALRTKLTALGKRHTGTPPRRWPYLILIGLLLSAIVALLLWPTAEQPTTTTPQEQLPTEATEQTPPVEENTPATSFPTDEQPSEEAPVSPPSAPAPAPPTNQAASPPPIAANFEPNPAFESLLGTQLRSGDYEFSLSAPQSTSTPQTLAFDGQLTTDETQADLPPFRLLIFSNDPRAFEQYQAIFAAPLSFTAEDASVFSFQAQPDETLTPGLYYYLIEDEDSGMMYLAGKVEVR